MINFELLECRLHHFGTRPIILHFMGLVLAGIQDPSYCSLIWVYNISQLQTVVIPTISFYYCPLQLSWHLNFILLLFFPISDCQVIFLMGFTYLHLLLVSSVIWMFWCYFFIIPSETLSLTLSPLFMQCSKHKHNMKCLLLFVSSIDHTATSLDKTFNRKKHYRFLIIIEKPL